MKIISFSEIKNLGISPADCVEWARNVIINKREYCLPPKISIKSDDGNVFFNTMPSMLPNQNVFGIKMVSRFPERKPSLKADILLYDSKNGDLLALMDGTWITTWRTGAVAAITIDLLKSPIAKSYSFIGLGNTARTTLICLDSIMKHEKINVKILAYKKQHEEFIERFKNYENIHFSVYDDVIQLIKESDVVISCVTQANSLFADESYFQKGVLVVPVHTKGFQNCDSVFDKIFCDDISHVSNFKYFDKFKSVIEMTDILNADISIEDGEERLKKRFLAYNIGVSTQDIYFASKIFNMIKKQDIDIENKFWV